jgi:hypothetical protein
MRLLTGECFPGTIETDFTPQIDGLDPEHFTLFGWDPPGYGRHGDAERYWEVDMLDRDADHVVDLMKASSNYCLALYSALSH